VAAQPLAEITRIGDAPPEKPRAAKAAARRDPRARSHARPCRPDVREEPREHGADVLKISAGHLADSGLVEMDTGIGKLSARLDLRTEQGAARLRQLLTEADVSRSPTPRRARGARLFAEALAALRPGIVCVSLSAWGEAGPWRARRGSTASCKR